MKPEWLKIFSHSEKQLLREILDKLEAYKKNGRSIFPATKNIFRSFDLYPCISVVIIGQDPYPTKGAATGYAFSVQSDFPIPASLRNIFKELKNDIGDYQTDRTLQHWAEQGVWLLNTTLTVEEGKPNSHYDLGWYKITNRVISHISENYLHKVFILWGNNARAKKRLIDDSKHWIIESAHPSPLSAHNGFFNSRPFSRANAYLQATGQKPIAW